MSEIAMTNGYPDPDAERDRLRRLLTRYRRCRRISDAGTWGGWKNKRGYAPYYAVRLEDIARVREELEAMEWGL